MEGRCFWVCWAIAAMALLGVLLWPTLARGFRGDSTLPRENGEVGPDWVGVAFAVAELMVMSPVTFRRIGGRPAGRPMRSPASLGRSETVSDKNESDRDVSVPSA